MTTAFGASSVAEPTYKHGVSVFGEFKYPPDFEHFDYVNPNAPKGGMLVLATGANWNSFTPLLHKGINPPGTSVINAAGLYDGLLTQAEDEFGTFYGNLAESVMIADDASWVRFRLRPEARWHDGEAVTARDVAFTYEHVRENSRHDIQSAFGMIESIEVHGERELTFHLLDLNGLSAMVVISLGKLPILPEHYWRDRDISQTTLMPPLGSGPYRVGQARQSRTILYERVPDYWGRHLAIHRGRHNFDYIRYDSYRDATVAREAFRKGLFDFRQESDPRFWHNGYNIPARDKGWIVMRRHNYGIYVGLSRGIAINGRREHLADVRVREALTLAFDFGWYDRTISQGFYTQPESYFAHTRFAAVGVPDAAELALLAPFRRELPERLFNQPFALPRHGFGRNRSALLRARELLRESGWTMRDGALRHEDSGEPFSLSIVVRSASEQRAVMQYMDQLRRLGIEGRIRLVETSRYINLMRDFDFDISLRHYGVSQPPGVELIAYFHSSNAQRPLTANRSGIELESVDAMMTRALNARSLADLTAAQRALDRILLWHFYTIPLVAVEGLRVVYWDKFGRPPTDAEYRTGFPDTWWYDEAKAARIELSN